MHPSKYMANLFTWKSMIFAESQHLSHFVMFQ
jgi:hypothetical protein